MNTRITSQVKKDYLAALKLIATENKWTQGALAVDDIGCYVDPRHSSACRFCSLGAIIKITGAASFRYYELFNILNNFFNRNGLKSLVAFNDTESYHNVIERWINFGKHYKILPESFTLGDPIPKV